ncbi:MAG: UDP-3-O-(3-hydroxymyristoyl)glucosamine N-acyltransferase [Cyanophyceae cyanobacterium]
MGTVCPFPFLPRPFLPRWPVKFSALVAFLEQHLGEALGDRDLLADPDLAGVGPLGGAIAGQLSYVESAKFAAALEQCQASALILPPDGELQRRSRDRGIAFVVARQPKLAFAIAVRQFYQPFLPEPGIHPLATIDPSVTLGAGVSIGAGAVLYENVTVGDGVCILPNVTIYPGVAIGARSVLHAHCTIHERTAIGDRCVIHSGAVVGGEGFGFVPTGQGWVKLEQTGRVVLEDDVEVGGNCTIDRPAMGETRIGEGTKLDNLVHIGHGCTIGRHCAIAAQTGLAGGVVLEDHVILAGQVGVANQVRLGRGAIASSKSGVHQDVAPGAIVSGYPAVANGLWLRTSALVNRLPDMNRLLKRLQRQIDHSNDNPTPTAGE